MKNTCMLFMAGLFLVALPGCVVGVDERGDWTLRPDPVTIDKGLDYLIRHEESAKGVTWSYYDAETGETIYPDDYHLYGIE